VSGGRATGKGGKDMAKRGTQRQIEGGKQERGSKTKAGRAQGHTEKRKRTGEGEKEG